MRLSRVFDAILTIIAFGRKELCNLVDAACAAAVAPRSVEYALAELEFVLAQVILRLENYELQAENRKKGGLEGRPRYVLAKMYHGNRWERDCFGGKQTQVDVWHLADLARACLV
jgi:hypothetical protein